MVIADAQRIERPVLFLLGGADRVVDVEAAQRLAQSLAAHARVNWYPDLSHELFNVPSVMDDLIAFTSGYRSSDPDPTSD